MPNDHRQKDEDNVTFTHDVSTLYDESGELSPYQREKFSPVLDAIADYFLPRNPLSEVRLLDVGVGYGAFLRLCELRGMSRLWGMDPYPESIRITIHGPSWWRALARDAGWEVLDDWRGEHLTHVKPVANRFRPLCRITGIDHRKIPFLRPFQQGYIMIARPATGA